MNKKYLSVILFGALMLGTTGTFTSCKDYDDDINNLQTQINSNKDAIAALQKLVGEGKWVTSVTPIENGFTVTMSDGTSQTVTGINGKDGKPGTVITLDPTTNNWIIDGVDTGICAKGEKGDKGDTGAAGEQGPAGTPGEQGPAGANGKNAPSPQIDPETGNWIVYAWDETTGDYKATVTDVYAHAANVYVVKKEGYIELNVDDVAYQLPTTSDAYTVQAPFTTVTITTETGKWNPTTTSKDYQTLLKAFPEIGEIEKGTLLKQGAELPVLVSPASIDLTEGFTFSLQSLKDGMVEDITLSNPAKGISSEWDIQKGTMTRAANTEDCLWTLQIEQELKDGKYAHADNVALVVENANGKVVKTPFVYTISEATDGEDVSVKKGNDNPEFAAEIDLLAPVIKADGTEGEAPIQITDEYEGKYIITLADQLQVEKYGLSIVDGHKLAIATPGNETNIPVTLNVVALGLNGSTYNTAKAHDITINVTQTIASTGQLSEKNITLSTKAISSTNLTIGQIVKWNIEELGFTTATQLDAFIKATKNITLVGEDKNGDEVTTSPYTVNVVDANGVGTKGYAKAKAFQIELPSKDLLPIEYKLVLEAKDGSSVIYKTETTLTVSNPKVEDLFALATAYTTDGKVLQVVGKVASNQVTYTIADGVVLKVNGANAQIVKYEDLDHANWEESDDSQTWGSVDWVTSDEINIPIEGVSNNEGKNHMNKERNIRGTFSLFGNSDNTIEYDFRIKVISAVYTADASNVKIDATKMAGNFGGSVDLTKGISATYAAGINVGKALSLFEIAATSKEVTYTYNVFNATSFTTSKTGNNNPYVLDADGKPIEIAKEDLIDFGMSVDDYIKVKDDDHYYLKANNDETTKLKGWSTIMTDLLKVYEDNNKGGLKLQDGKKEKDVKEVAIQKALFDKYGSKVAWTIRSETKIEKTEGQNKAEELASVVFTLADNDASKYCELKDNAIKANENISDSDLVDGKAVVNVKVAIKDIWGLTMTKTFQVTLTKK